MRTSLWKKWAVGQLRALLFSGAAGVLSLVRRRNTRKVKDQTPPMIRELANRMNVAGKVKIEYGHQAGTDV